MLGFLLHFIIYFIMGAGAALLAALDQIATASRKEIPAAVFTFLIYFLGAVIVTDLVSCDFMLKIAYSIGGATGAIIGIRFFNKFDKFFKKYLKFPQN